MEEEAVFNPEYRFAARSIGLQTSEPDKIFFMLSAYKTQKRDKLTTGFLRGQRCFALTAWDQIPGAAEFGEQKKRRSIKIRLFSSIMANVKKSKKWIVRGKNTLRKKSIFLREMC